MDIILKVYSATEETVKTNLKLYGEIDNVIIRKGFFDETLPNHKEEFLLSLWMLIYLPQQRLA